MYQQQNLYYKITCDLNYFIGGISHHKKGGFLPAATG